MTVTASSTPTQAIVQQWMKQLDEVAGTPVGKAAGELLQQILGSAFQANAQAMNPANINQRFSSPILQFTGKLKSLGVAEQTVGEVLNALSKLVESSGLPGLAEAAAPGGPVADSPQAESLQKAADLMNSLAAAAEDARQSVYNG